MKSVLETIGFIILAIACIALMLLSVRGYQDWTDPDQGPGLPTLVKYSNNVWKVTQIKADYKDDSERFWPLVVTVKSSDKEEQIWIDKNCPKLKQFINLKANQTVRFQIVLQPIKGMGANRYFEYLELK